MRKVFNYTHFDDKYDEFQSFLKQYQEIDTNNLVLTPFFLDRYTWPKRCFNNILFRQFEFLSLPIPGGYDEILSIQYGDWHKYVKGGNLHGGVFFDSNKPYVEYIK